VRYPLGGMPDKKPLRVSTAFGPSRDQTLLFTAHPDEEHDKNGDPVAKRRTLILALKGNQATFVDEQPVPLVRSWYSATSGAAYCSSVRSNKIHKFSANKWSDEVFASSAPDFVRFIFGLGGDKPEEDQLFLSTTSGLFVRIDNVWAHHDLEGERFPYQSHGRKPSEVFVGGPTLWRWDGQGLTALDPPEDDTASAVWVTADDRLVVGSTYLSVSKDDGEWERIDAPVEDFGNLVELGGTLYASSGSGVVRVMPGGTAKVSPTTEVDRLVAVGDALVAIGDDRSLVGEGRAWQDIQLPACEVGKRP
jgi:hypothetical protein